MYPENLGLGHFFPILELTAFMQTCSNQEIPVLDDTAEELDAELEIMRDVMA